MAVNIVAKYFNPTLAESFTAPPMTLLGYNAVTDAEVSDQCNLIADPLWTCPDYLDRVLPNVWCHPMVTVAPCQLVGIYRLPTLLRRGTWELTIGLTLESAGTPPDPFDPDTECYWECFWGCNGYGFEAPGTGGSIPTWPGAASGSSDPYAQINFIEGATGACAYTDTFMEVTFEVGIPGDDLYPCSCGGLNLPEIWFGFGGGISSYDVAISGSWLSDFTP